MSWHIGKQSVLSPFAVCRIYHSYMLIGPLMYSVLPSGNSRLSWTLPSGDSAPVDQLRGSKDCIASAVLLASDDHKDTPSTTRQVLAVEGHRVTMSGDERRSAVQ